MGGVVRHPKGERRKHGVFLNLRVAEETYGISYDLMYRWVQRGILPKLDSTLAGKAILVRRSDLEALLEQHMEGTAPFNERQDRSKDRAR
jgi:hypothetical protein